MTRVDGKITLAQRREEIGQSLKWPDDLHARRRRVAQPECEDEQEERSPNLGRVDRRSTATPPKRPPLEARPVAREGAPCDRDSTVVS